MRALQVDSFAQAIEVKRKFPNVFYTNRYQKLIVEAAKTNSAFFDVEQK
jgi:hypothetical protein